MASAQYVGNSIYYYNWEVTIIQDVTTSKQWAPENLLIPVMIKRPLAKSIIIY